MVKQEMPLLESQYIGATVGICLMTFQELQLTAFELRNDRIIVQGLYTGIIQYFGCTMTTAQVEVIDRCSNIVIYIVCSRIPVAAYQVSACYIEQVNRNK